MTELSRAGLPQQKPSSRQSGRPRPRREYARGARASDAPGQQRDKNRPGNGNEVGVAGKEPSAEVRPPLGAVLVPGIPEETLSQPRHRRAHATRHRRPGCPETGPTDPLNSTSRTEPAELGEIRLHQNGGLDQPATAISTGQHLLTGLSR
jgi:hypothetical protein